MEGLSLMIVYLLAYSIMFNIIYFVATFNLEIKDNATRANLNGQCAIATSILALSPFNPELED